VAVWWRLKITFSINKLLDLRNYTTL